MANQYTKPDDVKKKLDEIMAQMKANAGVTTTPEGQKLDTTSTQNTIKQYFEGIFGRPATDKDIADWTATFTKDGINPTPKTIVEGLTNSAKELLVGVGKPAPTPQEEAQKQQDWIKQLYTSIQPGVESAVTSAAAKRGGLDTGGYLTSVGKANASTWQDMLKTIIGQTNTTNTLAEQKRQFDINQQTTKDSTADYYKLLTAQSQAQQPGGWQYILGGAGAGAALGPWGALGGALLGWGAKQGLFK